MKHIGISAGAVVVALSVLLWSSLALPAFAFVVAGEGQGSAHAQVGSSSAGVEGEVHTTIQVGAGSSSAGENENNAAGGAMASSSHTTTTYGQEVSGQRNEGQQGSAMATEHAQSAAGQEHAGGEMEFNRATATSSTEITNPREVRTASDLRAFSAGVFAHNKHVTNISVSTTSVSTTFDSPARLFGFIPASLPAQAKVSNDGAVRVSFPWYAFLFATDHAALQAAIASSTAEAGVGARTSLTAEEQAALVQRISSAISGFLGSLSANANSNASIQ